MLIIQDILPFTRSLLEKVIQPGDTTVDATVGNGHDTLFLAQQVGESGRVLAYDIQQSAIENTRQKLVAAGFNRPHQPVSLLHKGHETVKEELERLQHPLSAAMFNLGYLPGGDKQITTRAETTITALHTLGDFLKPGGLMTLVVYSGHEQGKTERDQLLTELRTWKTRHFQVLHYQFLNRRNDPPFLLAIQKNPPTPFHK